MKFIIWPKSQQRCICRKYQLKLQFKNQFKLIMDIMDIISLIVNELTVHSHVRQ